MRDQAETELTEDQKRGERSVQGWGDIDEPRKPVEPTDLSGTAAAVAGSQPEDDASEDPSPS